MSAGRHHLISVNGKQTQTASAPGPNIDLGTYGPSRRGRAEIALSISIDIGVQTIVFNLTGPNGEVYSWQDVIDASVKKTVKHIIQFGRSGLAAGIVGSPAGSNASWISPVVVAIPFAIDPTQAWQLSCYQAAITVNPSTVVISAATYEQGDLDGDDE